MNNERKLNFRKSFNAERQLAAILFADIVDYTALMQTNDEIAIQTVEYFQYVLSEIAQKFKGQLIKNYGDGSLVIFHNSLAAVRAAKEIQEACKGDKKPFVHNFAIPLRIGIHVGEFVVRDNDIFGNGVNLASRLESLGIAGSVLISREVFLKIKNHSEIQTVSLGSFELKNVEEPMEVFALANKGFVVPDRKQVTGKLKIQEPRPTFWQNLKRLKKTFLSKQNHL